MELDIITPRRAVDNAYLQETITKKNFTQFRRRLLKLLEFTDKAVEEEESEEHMKNLIQPFLRNTNFGEDYFIYPKGREDLAIHNGKTRSSTVGVIIETKRPSNKEMITADHFNRKALHETILYYLQERLEDGNDDIRHIIITDCYRWFIFDAQDFEKHFYESKQLIEWYDKWKQGQKTSGRTEFIYDYLSDFISYLDTIIKAEFVDINDYRKLLEKEKLTRDDQKRVVPLFKLFTPTHLLKLPFSADSNSLNKGFYKELLYIMGLKEYKKKGTHYITRQDKDDRQDASLIENTITQLRAVNVLSRLRNPDNYGDDKEEQLFNIAIQLLITWINRILFLKLLEAQLYKYHREDERFKFLNHQEVEQYDWLNKLFFQVLARPVDRRSHRINKSFGHIPYLNSSLFDVAEIEQKAIRMSELEDGLQMPVYSKSKIRDDQGNRLKEKSLSTLSYLMRFLDSYNFNTEGTAEIQEEAKTLINASVLGRIFEKINGYRDGSIFTPGYITEYMSREAIRRAVVQKFNEAFVDWECEDIHAVKQKIARYEVSYQKANAIVNSITICDPAVGSGHFLVSALNELIAIKSDLRILVDDENIPLRDIDISVDNDELNITVGQKPFFEYQVEHEWVRDDLIKRAVGRDTQRLQKTLFREKNTLIENCLFGVDINPNSVNICRLRLWIELLKNAYYREETDHQRLEVLPNIDINIKQGNSLVSRFDLDADLSSVFKKSDYSLDDYKEAVHKYKETGDHAEKHRLQQLIDSIKKEYSSELLNNRPINKKLSKARGGLEMMQNTDLFGEQKFSEKEIDKQEKKVRKLEKKKAEEESGAFYNQAFEWRFEFPEVLDEEGNFAGFDVVIGNPPYISIQDLKQDDKRLVDYYKNSFSSTYGNYDIYIPFIELVSLILSKKSNSCLILPSKFLTTDYGKKIRELLINESLISRIVDFEHHQVFDSATTYTCILMMTKSSNNIVRFFKCKPSNILKENHKWENLSYKKLRDTTWNLISEDLSNLIDKCISKGVSVEDIPCLISRGSSTGNDKIFVFEENNGSLINGYDEKVNIEDKLLVKPVYAKDYTRYNFKHNSNKYLIFPYNWKNGKYEAYSEEKIDKIAPKTFQYLKENKKRLMKRKQYSSWYLYSAARNLKIHGGSDILIPLLADRGLFTLTPTDKEYTLMAGGGFSISIKGSSVEKKYLLGLLNSKLLFRILYTWSNRFRGGFITCTKQYFKNLPILLPSKAKQNKVTNIVDEILQVKKSNPSADTSKLEAEIDQLVYELYGLSEEEIEIVEGSME